MGGKDCCDDFLFGAWGGRRGRRFRWRIFERGDLKFVILRLISEKDMHGYEVIQALEEESGGWYKPSPGSVYPTLQMLEDEGYVHSREEDGKKIYTITDAGKEYLDEHGDVVDEIVDRVTSFADRFWGKESRDLSSAFSRLAHQTFESAFAWGLDSDSVRDITEIIEQALSDIDDVRKGKRKKEDDEGGGEDPPAKEAAGAKGEGPPSEETAAGGAEETKDAGTVKDEEEY